MRLLIVDDERSVCLALADYLSDKEWAVDCAHELEEAEALLGNFPYDVVITDMRLSRFAHADGLEIVSFIRYRHLDVSLIVLTAFESDEIRHELDLLGVDAFLYKPQPLEAIARLIDQLADGTGRKGHPNEP